jgi:spore coat polysaccharide biosynthesis predicted glycosyltransferase SpsG
MCVLGLPTLLIPVAENQIGAATELARRGLHAYFNQTVQPSRLRKAFWELMLSAMARESSRTVLARYWTRAPNESLQKFSLRTEMVSDDFLS